MASLGAAECRAANFVVSDFATCDGVADDTAALQALFDAVPSGSSIEFDAPAGRSGECRTTDVLRVRRSMRIFGSDPDSKIHRTDVFPLIPTSNQGPGSVLWIERSNVTVENLEIEGHAYGNVAARNTNGVHAWSQSPPVRLTNITFRNLRVSKVRGRGLSLQNVDDFIIEDNHVEDVGYAGIFGEGVRRGWIRGNTVIDVGDPETCEGMKACRNHSTYGIVVTGGGGLPLSEDVLISNNLVREVETWVGIMNHGGHRVLIFDNEVYDTNFLYANTTRPSETDPNSSDETSFINNYGDTLPRIVRGRYDIYQPTPHGEGLWFYAQAGYPAHDVMAIGNTFRNTGYGPSGAGVLIWSSVGARFTWNRLQTDAIHPRPIYGLRFTHSPNPTGAALDAIVAHNEIVAQRTAIRSDIAVSTRHVVAHNLLEASLFGLHILTPGRWYVANNDFGSTPVPVQGAYSPWIASTQTPPPPSTLVAHGYGAGRVRLWWDFGNTPHDSFYIEKRSGFGSWQRVAFRPPNHAKWRFDAPTNPDWTTFRPTVYFVSGLPSGVVHQFRVRVNNGDKVSAWSPTATLTVP